MHDLRPGLVVLYAGERRRITIGPMWSPKLDAEVVRLAGVAWAVDVEEVEQEGSTTKE